jgi:hypothetical protein
VHDNPLERRDILKLAAGACVAGAETACTPAAHPGSANVADVAAQLDPAAADAMLAKLDRRMAWIGEASLPEDVLPLSRLAHGPEFDRELASTGPLVRKAVRTLYLTGRFLDLPEEMKVHPGVQSRVRAMQPEMDDAVLGLTERLERMTPDDHRRLQSHLRKDRLFGERLARVLERTAAEDGLSFQRTFGLRATTLQLSERMAAQSPALVIDPLVSKVRRIEAHPRSDAEEARRFAARVGERAFWAHQERVALLHEAWKARLGPGWALASTSTDAPLGPAVPPAPTTEAVQLVPAEAGAPTAAATYAPPSPPQSSSTQGQRTMRVGAITMGFGLGSVALGLIFAGLASATSAPGLIVPALVFGVTVGPILLAVGLVVVLVGLAMRTQE